MNEQQKRKKIFLSYHSSKLELVEHLSKYLERNDLETWYAPRNIHSGEQWDESIHLAIKDCKAVVLLFCELADSSIQVKRELSLADKYKKPVYWLRVERVEPNNLSYFLTSTQWLDWMDLRDETLEQLVRDLSAPDLPNMDGNVYNCVGTERETKNSEKKTNVWSKGILAFENDREAAECAARVYFFMANAHPDSSIILPTGRSATMVFRAMLRILDEFSECPFGEAHIISDTETFGVWSEHDSSRTKHIKDTLIEPLKKKGKEPADEQLHLLSGVYTNEDPVRNAQKLLMMYPPSVHGVSVSPVGEILAYEVGTYNNIEEIIDDAPRIVEVGEHSKKYIDPNQPSKSILTIGLGSALSVDILLILAFDIQKANIVARLFNGPMTAGIPATLLRNHPNAYVITTKKVVNAAKLNDICIDNMTPKEAADWIVEK